MRNIIVGDLIEVEKDTGVVTNAPWCNKVIDIRGDTFYFDEGSGTPVGYTLAQENLKGKVLRKTNTLYIFRK